MNITNITIVGLGVIGASYAHALISSDYNLYGIDINEKSINTAKTLGIINDGAIYNSSDTNKIISKTDLLILCIYPRDIKTFLEKYKMYFKRGLIITDVTGIKTKVINDIDKILPYYVDFVFAHPMAGKEKRGINYSSKDMFEKANFIITPIPTNLEENIDLIENLAYTIGFKNVKKISPEEHDQIISFTSQLPHAIAVSLINSDNLNINTSSFIGDSYRELTRIANINEDLWSELFLENKENLINSIDQFQNKLESLKQCLILADSNTLRDMFIESSNRREKLDNN